MLFMAGTPRDEMTKLKISAIPTANPAAMDQPTPARVITVVFFLVASHNTVPQAAATHCNRTPPNIGSIREEARLMKRLYKAYDRAQERAAPIQLVKGGGISPPPRSRVSIEKDEGSGPFEFQSE